MKEREKEILGLIIESHIKESRPIGSVYLCQRYNLKNSPATVRNIMVSLEKQGLLSHTYTSSGRVPTKEGFKYYVEFLKEEDALEDYPVSLDFYSLPDFNIDEVINHSLDVLTQLSGYTSLMAISGRDEKLFFRGVRFMLEQPEFENIDRLKHIFYTLEVKIDELQSLLFNCISEKIQIFVGDDIGVDEFSDCSLVVSGLREKQLAFAIALLGPMRMNYAKASACLSSVRNQLEEVVEEFI